MEGIKYFEGRKVFLILKNKRQYSGTVIEIADTGKGLVFITLLDKFNNRVCFTSGEIEVIQEEKL
jgi:hypothetical protein